MTQAAPRPASSLTRLQRRRLSWCMAKGMPLKKAARRQGLDGPGATELLEDEGIAALVEAYRSMVRMPEDERHRRLVEMALRVIEEAITRQDPRVALFVIRPRTMARDPAEMLAKGVVRALEREARAPEPKPDPHPAASLNPREPTCPVDNATAKAAAMLRSEILDEVETRAAVEAARRDGRVYRPKPARQVRRRGEGRPALPTKQLSPRQIAFLQKLSERRTVPTGMPPETVSHNPNAP